MKKLVAIAIVSFGVPGAALAQSCTTPPSPGDASPSTCLSGGVPQLSNLSGSMTIVRGGAALTATNGMQLKVGDRLITRGGGRGDLALTGARGGSCSVSIAANSTVTIAKSGANTCVTQRTNIVSNPQSQVSQASAPSAPPPEVPVAPVAPAVAPVAPAVAQGVSPLAIGIGGSIIAGGVGIAVSQSRNDRLSP